MVHPLRAAPLAAAALLAACISSVVGTPELNLGMDDLDEVEKNLVPRMSSSERSERRAMLASQQRDRRRLTDSSNSSSSGTPRMIHIQVHTNLCVDHIDWRDSAGNGCAVYSSEGWCGSSSVADLAVDGVDADAACCSCGGGRTREGGCLDHPQWAPYCEQWRGSGWCAHSTYGPNWTISANGTFENYTIAGVPVDEGCCDCGRASKESFTLAEEILQPYRSVAREVASISLLSSSQMVSGPLPEWIGEFEGLEVLELSGRGLEGSLPAGISSMGKLLVLHIADTSLAGSIPDEIGELESLRALDLQGNNLRGPIPATIGNITELSTLELDGNELSGSIPASIGLLAALTVLKLDRNSLTGPIPDSIGGLTSLNDMELDDNKLTGSIPASIGELTALTLRFYLGDNSLKGTIPSSIERMTELKWLFFRNIVDLSGTLPSGIGALTRLDRIFLDHTSLSGPLPDSMARLLALQVIVAENTRFSGPVPEWLGELSQLFWLDLDESAFSGSIPGSLGKLPLFSLDLDANELLTGTLPPELFKGPRLSNLWIAGTQIKGSIPDLSEAALMQRINLPRNSLTGSIPSSIGEHTGLLQVNLGDNRLTGFIPAAVGSLTRLVSLKLDENQLSGPIPDAVAGMMALLDIYLHNNALTGTVPQLAALSNLQALRLENNVLSGDMGAVAFPTESLTRLAVAENGGLSGSLPNLENASALEEIDVAGCNLTDLDNLPPSLRRLDVSRNSLTVLPPSLFVLPSLESLDVSFNNIRQWPLNGAYERVAYDFGFCGSQLLAEPFQWQSLLQLDVSQNPLGVGGTDVYMFLQTLYWAPSITTIVAEGCGMLGDIPRWSFKRSFGDLTCDGGLEYEDAGQALSTLNMRGNRITEIGIGPPRLLVTAGFGENNLVSIHRDWFNEGADQETQQRRFAIAALNLAGNPALRFSTAPASSECGAETWASSLTADPSGFQGTDGASHFECTTPCPPWGMVLETDPGLPDEGSLCRCKEGYGIQPDDCWDAHWHDEVGRSCWWHANNGDNCSEPAVAAVCCHCGGSGAGGNGKHCFKCGQDTYSYAPDLYRHRSECTRCPEGSATPSTQNGSAATSVCSCQCPVGSYMEGASHCQAGGQSDVASLHPSSLRCVACPALKTTLSAGAFSLSDCVCDLRGVAGLVEGVINGTIECGCESGTFLKRSSMQCEACSEGEDCEWRSVEQSLRAPPLKEGYWTATASLIGLGRNDPSIADFEGHSVYRCYSSRTCIDDRGTCARGREGLACSLCKPGYYGGPDGDCLKCSSSGLSAIIGYVILVPLAVMPSHMLLAGRQEGRGSLLRLRALRVAARQLVKHLQIMNVVGGFTVGWPDLVLDIFAKFTIQLSVRSISDYHCLLDEPTAAADVGAQMLVPCVFILLGILVTPLLAWVIRSILLFPGQSYVRLHKLAALFCMSLSDAARAVFWFALLFFSTLLNNGLTLFTCDISPNEERTVASYPHLHCLLSKSGADEEWMHMLPVAVVYLFGLLSCVLGVLLWELRKTWHCMEASGQQSRGYYSFLFEDYRDACVHWPIVLLCRDLAINLARPLLNNYGSTQLLVTAMCTLYVAMHCLKEKPFQDQSNSLLEACNSMSIFTICMYTAGMGFAKSPGLEDMLSSSEGTSGNEEMITRGHILAGLTIGSAVVPVLFIVHQCVLAVPCLERRLPRSLRPLSEEDQAAMRKELADHLEVDQQSRTYQLISRMDGTDLQSVVSTLRSSPATAEIIGAGDSHHLQTVDNLIHRVEAAGKHASAFVAQHSHHSLHRDRTPRSASGSEAVESPKFHVDPEKGSSPTSPSMVGKKTEDERPEHALDMAPDSLGVCADSPAQGAHGRRPSDFSI